MSTTSAEQSAPHGRVRTDLVAGGAVLAIVIGGNLLRHMSDAGIITALAGR